MANAHTPFVIEDSSGANMLFIVLLICFDRLQLMLQQLAEGDLPSVADLETVLHRASDALTAKGKPSKDETHRY